MSGKSASPQGLRAISAAATVSSVAARGLFASRETRDAADAALNPAGGRKMATPYPLIPSPAT
ncbi:hypothetical protein E2C01_058286 [Portunus trituberculatus]|uniref:Uncharacterized protein n=1 Tax=Portunus trituberculatus TaxID=210409 RepID=A0A5B7H3B9_PORTR|nr:hypothetical protein [Portunus trituberculatus]